MKQCEYFYGTARLYCCSPATEEVIHKDPTSPYAQPYKGEDTILGDKHKPGEPRHEWYCSKHANEVRSWWVYVEDCELLEGVVDTRTGVFANIELRRIAAEFRKGDGVMDDRIYSHTENIDRQFTLYKQAIVKLIRESGKK